MLYHASFIVLGHYISNYIINNYSYITYSWLIPLILHLIHWFVGFSFLIADIFFPNSKNKIYKNSKEPSYKKIIKTLFITHLKVIWTYIPFFQYLFRNYNCYRAGTLLETFIYLPICIGIYDLVFHIGHYLMHANSYIYKNIHKLHHSTYGTKGLTANYMTSLDLMMEGNIPMFFTLLLCTCNISPTAMVAFGTLGSFNVVYSHSGWTLPFRRVSGNHYLHHKYINYNYSTFFDYLFGTKINLTNP